MEKEKTVTMKSNQTLDLEARLEAEKKTDDTTPDAEPRYAVKGNDLSDYVGVNPEYQTYADDTHKPMRAEKGAEKVFEDRALKGMEAIAENSKSVGIHGYSTDNRLDQVRAEREKAEADEKAKADKEKAATGAGSTAGSTSSQVRT